MGSKFWTDKWTRSVVNFNGKTSSFRQHAAGYSFYVGGKKVSESVDGSSFIDYY